MIHQPAPRSAPRAARLPSRLLRLAAALGFAAQLAACVPVVVAGVAAGTYAATDRRSLGAQADDKTIFVKAESRLRDVVSERGHVNVTTFNHKVLLTGEVPDQATKDRAASVIRQIETVEGVINELEVNGQTSLTSRSSDAFITGQVKARLVDSKDVFANAYKVTTERGIVYLMGRVTRGEGERAGEIARTVSGVVRVVKAFDYISDGDLRQFQATPAPDQPGPRS